MCRHNLVTVQNSFRHWGPMVSLELNEVIMDKIDLIDPSHVLGTLELGAVVSRGCKDTGSVRL